MPADPLVSVIIPTKDRQEKLATCLRGVFLQRYRPKQVIVVDNASSDGTREMLRKQFPETLHIYNSTNRGAAVAKNQGISVARGEYVWFLDSDVRIDNPDCLSTMVSLMREHPDIGSLGGELCRLASGKMACVLKYLLISGQGEGRYFEPEKVILKECDYCATCNCLVRRSDVAALGGFDPGYFIISEDAELGYRLQRSGKRNVCDYRTAVFHDIDVRQQRNVFLRIRNPARLAIKNFPFYYVLLLPFSTIALFRRVCAGMLLRTASKDPGVWKYLPQAGTSRGKRVLFIFKLLFFTAGAYLLNLFFLPRTILSRWRRRDYIQDAARFTVIKS